MNRKIAIIVAAIVLPGGLLALLGVLFVRALSRTAHGRKVLALAQKRMAAFREAGAPWSAERQAA